MPKEREKKLPKEAAILASPNNVENREKINSIPKASRKTAVPMAIVRNLKYESLESLNFKPAMMFRKIHNPPLHYRQI